MAGLEIPSGIDESKKKSSSTPLESLMDMEKTRMYLTAQ
jgi:hypothetical protein